MNDTSTTTAGAGSRVSRRNFLHAGAAGAGLMILGATNRARAQAAAPAGAAPAGGAEEIKVGLVGCGAQGRVLLEACVGIPGLKFVAVCDVWPYNLKYGQNYLKKFGHDPSAHEEFEKFLDAGKSNGMQAVVIAVPDIWHSPYTVQALKAGYHVYCEKMMSNTVEGARAMVRAMKETGKLCQIGHQRRSNPRYIYALQNIMNGSKMLGRVVNANAQWNQSIRSCRSMDLGWPAKYELPQATLEKYGYANMREFRNWRWFRKYSAGPVSALGAHQVDVFNWFLGVKPKTVMASGGNDHFTDREWYDNAMAVYEYALPGGTSTRASYRVLTTTSAGGGYYEHFMGTDGTLKMSENSAITRIYKEGHADWSGWYAKGHIKDIVKPETIPASIEDIPAALCDMGPTPKFDLERQLDFDAYELPIELTKKVHQPHLENFFDAVRGKAKLNCAADEAFESEAAVLKVNVAIEARKQLVFEPADFEA